jgi:hypothetical protein
LRELLRPSQRLPGRPRPPRPPPRRPRSRASPPRPRLSFPQTGAEDGGSPSALVPSPCGHSQRPTLNGYPEMPPTSCRSPSGARRSAGAAASGGPNISTGTDRRWFPGRAGSCHEHGYLRSRFAQFCGICSKISDFRRHNDSGLAGATLQFAGADERVSRNGSGQAGGPFSGRRYGRTYQGGALRDRAAARSGAVAHPSALSPPLRVSRGLRP